MISNKDSSHSFISKMNSLVSHRGPDDEGIVLFPKMIESHHVLGTKDTAEDCFAADLPYTPDSYSEKDTLIQFSVGLGHRRLSILDLSPLGHQPMCDFSKRFWITYNGEIYNYKEIKKELESLGFKFISNSDTEIILYSYIYWGEACLEKFNGMWAFCIFDSKEKNFFIARDRFGVKPLYYWFSSDKDLLFGSEIKQFTAHPTWKPKINLCKAYEFLAFGYSDHTSETLFENVFHIPPGHYSKFSYNEVSGFLNKLPVHKWYDLKLQKFTGNREQADKKFEQLFLDSVRLRLRSDVAVGSCLSGGLDSSSIVVVMNSLLKDSLSISPFKTFSLFNLEKRFDESEFVHVVVNATSADSYSVLPDPKELFENLKLLTWIQDEPFGSSSIYAQWKIFELSAKSNVKVVLDGQGGDEILAGYTSFFGPKLAELLKSFSFISFLKEKKSMSIHQNYNSSVKDLIKAFLPDFLFRWGKSNKKTLSKRFPWLNIDLFLEGIAYEAPFSVGQARSIQSLSKYQIQSSILPRLLHWEDRDSMYHSIESRLPFLDYRLVEFCLSLPSEFLINEGVTKNILRSALKSYLPEKIIKRNSKLGFETPEEDWIKSSHSKLFRDKIERSINLSNGLITDEALNLFDDIRDGKKPYDHQIWRIICFGAWIEVFEVRL